ncbi:MAG: hypothetical protein IPF73_10710 [Betaproteobacteria bacterium]|nr:hypothetical protein [Betaproteobacteria bacterium]
MKRMIQCRYGMAAMDWGLDIPDGINPMSMFYSKAIGGANMSCFVDAEFDAAYESALVTPSGPARSVLFRTMQARPRRVRRWGRRPPDTTALGARRTSPAHFRDDQRLAAHDVVHRRRRSQRVKR